MRFAYMCQSKELPLLMSTLQITCSYNSDVQLIVLITDSQMEKQAIYKHYYRISTATVDCRLNTLFMAQSFGSGFNKSVAHGGFDEICARNTLVQLARRTDIFTEPREFTMFLDPDEFVCRDIQGAMYKSLVIDRKYSALPQEDIIRCVYAHHLQIENRYTGVSPLRRMNRQLISYVDTKHPHPRIFSTKMLNRISWKKNPEAATRVNNTEHCVVRVRNAAQRGAANIAGIDVPLFHLGDLIKRRPSLGQVDDAPALVRSHINLNSAVVNWDLHPLTSGFREVLDDVVRVFNL